MTDLAVKGVKVKEASRFLRLASTTIKNQALKSIAGSIDMNRSAILVANSLDVLQARNREIKESLIDRLALTEKRIDGMIQSCYDVAALSDPVGEIETTWIQKDGLRISRERVPLGAIGMIYESRPNVTVDASILALKSGNSVLLKGGSDAINSNRVIVSAIKRGLEMVGLPEGCVELIEDVSRDCVMEMLKMREYLSLIIPRGGSGLIQFVVNNSTVPVIETGTGNCHIFVDYNADLRKAVSIVDNAKTQRPGTCNAVETILVHEKIAGEFLPMIKEALSRKNVELRGCEKSRQFVEMVPATEEDYETEFLDLILAVKVVRDVKEAVEHIERYSSHHSESILTQDYSNARYFLKAVDSAAVYVNASTRFTDGGEFGFGSEIGISTQKLHARGPFGLRELTSYKYTVMGDYQVRE
ncbi:MAG: glutamate-5-semialdehyde dehydrogenase [Thermotogaceae bacterium]|jgi:glutamate-5-semialdehyde dehydrogenase|nr:glutamate-5-semialdehyde dehydrogenase [Mesotoga sp.]MDI9375569.1 glutamate-5-semialdehyde dehydrogenase [Thermotogota bacterium]NLX33008.1 glutamate-5-semialdehyde dehydrogenase [Thermotogaceae bacterium]MDD5743699.1 glutamate-5-semialdehyde dehydrogenase [Mesotoga sp.]HOI63329.1 glutamate-5-semialdehyde dehydrogenase [Mesotoga sp.]